MNKDQRNSVRVVRLEQIKPYRCRIVGGFESAKQSRKHQTRRRRIVTKWRREIGGQRASFSFNSRCQLLCRATQRERRFLGVEIERGRNRCGDSPRWREPFRRINPSHANKCAANALLNVFL